MCVCVCVCVCVHDCQTDSTGDCSTFLAVCFLATQCVIRCGRVCVCVSVSEHVSVLVAVCFHG